MRLRDKSNLDICKENHLPYAVLMNTVEEEESKNRMRATSNLIAKALIATLGPYGSSTIIQDREGKHFASKDGYDLMRRLSFSDDVSRTILDLYRTAASNQVFTVGDGSTSAIVVANALYQSLTDPEHTEHFDRIAPKDIVDILNDLSEMVKSKLKEMAIPVSDDMHELDTVAAVANNNDSRAGKLVGDIYRKIGRYGFISMDTTEKHDKDEYEIKSGVEWDRGYIDPIYGMDFIDNTVIYEQNPRIIISNSILTYDDIELALIPLIKEGLNQENAELVIVANDFDDDVRNFLKSNRTKHIAIGSNSIPMNFIAVDIDQVTQDSRNKLEDLALMCGCKIYDKYRTPKADIIAHPDAYIGHAMKVQATPKLTQILFNEAEKLPSDHRKLIDKKTKEFADELDKLLKIETPNNSEIMKIYELRKRIARMTSSTALLHIGGQTASERSTRQRLFEDAIFACKSTLRYGYVPGGNICIPKILRENKEAFASILGIKYDYLPIDNIRIFLAYFIDLISDAFLESYRAVLNNSYMTEMDVEKTIEKCLNENKFYNLKMHEYEDFDKTNVINSVDTDIQILNSCISIIGILSTSNQFLTLNEHPIFDSKKEDE